MPAPTDSIYYATQVIRAMNDLLGEYRDPNNLGEKPDGDTRSGIRFIFEAAAMQLDHARTQIEVTNNEWETHGDVYPRFEPGPEELDLQVEASHQLSWNDWQSPSQWAAHGLKGLPTTRQGLTLWIRNDAIHKNPSIKRPRKKSGGGWEYHFSVFPTEAQKDFHRRKDFMKQAYNHQENA